MYLGTAGGWLERGEEPTQAIQREIEEELNLKKFRTLSGRLLAFDNLHPRRDLADQGRGEGK